jgi:hypothetical protein
VYVLVTRTETVPYIAYIQCVKILLWAISLYISEKRVEPVWNKNTDSKLARKMKCNLIGKQLRYKKL